MWGLIHGVLVVASSMVRKQPLTIADTPLGPSFPQVSAILRALVVFFIACLAWVFFRVEAFPDAIGILDRMLIRIESFDVTLTAVGSLGVFTKLLPIMLLAELCTRDREHPLTLLERFPKPLRWFFYLGLMWGTLYYMPEESGEFVYFQF